MMTFSWEDFWIIFFVCSVFIFICRVLPMFFLKDKQLPASFVKIINFIPPAAFAALVANDIFDAKLFESGLLSFCIVIGASLVVVFVAYKSKSLIYSIIAGVGTYTLFTILW